MGVSKAKPSAWDEAKYEAAGKVKVGLRLSKEAAATLAAVSDAKGISRQAIIEAFLANPELVASIANNPAQAEQPLYEPGDLVDAPEDASKK